MLGARGAVGRSVVGMLVARGLDVTPAGRRAPDGGVEIDLSRADGRAALAAAARDHAVIVNASGVEDPGIAGALGDAALVEVSATSAYLTALRDAAPTGAGIVLGAGLAPGLSTTLAMQLRPEPDEEIDVAVVLGGGEQHGAAAVAWTAGLAGAAVHGVPGELPVRNFRERRRLPGGFGRRIHLRADFPDQAILGPASGARIRSYLAVDSRLSTEALWAVGRWPALRGLVARAPHLGGDGWSVTAVRRRTGESVGATGRGQSTATAALVADAAIAAADRRLDSVVTQADVLPLDRALHAAGAAPWSPLP